MTTRPPLPERLRPDHLDDVVGHTDQLGPGGELRRMVDDGALHSVVLWGPPGCGKTTLARLLASTVGARWIPLSAVLDGVAALRKVVDEAAQPALTERAPPVVFVDEIHRWNKAQQDALLPHVESGTLVLVGATTENPSIALRPALRSRLRLVHLTPPDRDAIAARLQHAWTHPDGLGRPDPLDAEVAEAVARAGGGDVRRSLVDLERLSDGVRERAPTLDDVPAVLGRPDLRHDRDGDSHYDLVSAWIKSMRGSDPDAALYWLARLIAGGEDPVFLCRRLVIFAAEDVGNADPRALAVATDAAAAVQLVGLPEGRIPLAQATTWLACAPKSNAAYTAIDAALEEVRRTGALPVPPHLRSAPGAAEREAGIGVGYVYPHDAPDRIVDQQHRPDEVEGHTYYRPVDHGEERIIRQRLDWWHRRLGRASGDQGTGR